MRFLVVCLAGGLLTPTLMAADAYTLPPEATRREGVPTGTITKHTHTSQVFAGTVRDYWVYIPAQCQPKDRQGGSPAAVMVFQDGQWYQDPQGQWRVPIIMDNLIHEGAMPVTVGIFVNPGGKPDAKTDNEKRFNRSFEYDTLSSQYATFLEKEILPEVGKRVQLRTDRAGRAICGISSGGICAFTAAWERPDLFSKVLSHVGSFTNIRHGDTYPGIVRKADPKPIRVYLQDGAGDLDNPHGSWPLGNLSLAAALRFRDYDYKFVYGDGAHNGKHGAALMAESLRWLWRDWKSELKK